MKKPIRVRYLTFSRVALEIVTTLSDAENAEFNRILFSCFRQLENGQPPEYKATSSPVLNVALQEAVDELQEGYKNYLQKVNARKNAEDQRSTADQPPIDQRSTIEEKRREKEEKEESRYRSEGMQGGRPFNPLEHQSISIELSHTGIQTDPSFWSLAERAGYRITVDSIRKAKEQNSCSLKYVVKLIKEAMRGVS